MSIIADIKRAKAEYEGHLAKHKCSQLERCEKRAELLQAWYGTAGMWAEEPDDDRRQREHFERNYKRPAA
jgi:hypothetical protein